MEAITRGVLVGYLVICFLSLLVFFVKKERSSHRFEVLSSGGVAGVPHGLFAAANEAEVALTHA